MAVSSSRSVQRQRAALQALLSVFGAMKGAMRAELQADGGAPIAPMLLRLLLWCREEPGITQQGLVRQSGRDKGQVARMVKELLDLGLLLREPHPDDGRSHCLRPSPEGLAACTRFEAAEAGAASRLFGHLGAAELEALTAQWRALADRARPPEGEPA